MKSVKIGNQVWMQENLAIDDGDEGITYNPDNGQYYYTWDAAMRVAESIPGWHLPTAEEWNSVAEACGAEIVDNDGTEKLYDSLSVLPVGYCNNSSFYYVDSFAYFWSATEYCSDGAYIRAFNTKGVMGKHISYRKYGYSVRLIKD